MQLLQKTESFCLSFKKSGNQGGFLKKKKKKLALPVG